MGTVETKRVDLTSFQMTSSAKKRWHEYVRGRTTCLPPLTWAQFSKLFLDKFIPFTQREDFRGQFDRLQQGSMTITQYGNKLLDLSCHEAILITSKTERVRRFINSLTYRIRLEMARETKDDISFTRLRILLIRSRGFVARVERRHLRKGLIILIVLVVLVGSHRFIWRRPSCRLVQSALQVSHSPSGGHGVYGPHSSSQYFMRRYLPLVHHHYKVIMVVI